MKKLLLCALLILSLAALIPSTADCKPAACFDALQRCYQRCAEFYMDITFMVDGCKAGCNLGYILC